MIELFLTSNGAESVKFFLYIENKSKLSCFFYYLSFGILVMVIVDNRYLCSTICYTSSVEQTDGTQIMLAGKKRRKNKINLLYTDQI